MFGDKVRISKSEYNTMASVLDTVQSTLLEPINNAKIIKLDYDGIDCEAGLIVGINNPNYQEIKELAFREVD